MENINSEETSFESKKLIGLLSDEDRLRVVAAIILGADILENIRTATGLDDIILMKCLTRLESGGIVEYQADSGYRICIEVFRDAARSSHKETSELSGLERVIRDGRLPKSRNDRLPVLKQMADLFEPDRRYPEAEVNSHLKTINPDHALLRRYLIDEGFLKRENETMPDGHTVMIYWRNDQHQFPKT
jgi:hypothetical protein